MSKQELTGQVIFQTDGASRGNPGEASIAYWIQVKDSARIEYKERVGLATNNQAEYLALVAALKRLLELGVTDSDLIGRMDSELVVKQVRGEYRVKNPQMAEYNQEVQSLVKQLELAGNSLTMQAIRREENKLADQLANEALDGR